MYEKHDRVNTRINPKHKLLHEKYIADVLNFQSMLTCSFIKYDQFQTIHTDYPLDRQLHFHVDLGQIQTAELLILLQLNAYVQMVAVLVRAWLKIPLPVRTQLLPSPLKISRKLNRKRNNVITMINDACKDFNG